LLGIKMSEVELLDIQINDNADISEAKNIMENYRIAALTS